MFIRVVGGLGLLLQLLTGTANRQSYRQPLKVIKGPQYLNQIKRQPQIGLVEISKVIPGVRLDIRYATTHNFMHRQMYTQARAFARVPVVLALKNVQADLARRGLGLKIYDAYRPYTVTLNFYKQAIDRRFVANPKRGSKHNRGCAVDVGLINLKTNVEMPMPTNFDEFSASAAANYIHLPKNVLNNRDVLIATMQKHGFSVLKNEWWHFDYRGWRRFDVLDVPFEML
jgi:D-alanyl-D-alanine dipeptidase